MDHDYDYNEIPVMKRQAIFIGLFLSAVIVSFLHTSYALFKWAFNFGGC